MLATWEHSRGGTLTVADYQASGGIRNALTQTAEQAYESLTDGQQRLARQLFLRLVHVADGVPPSRARSRSANCPAGTAGDAEPVLATFVGERMITVDADAAQITHDALLTAWPRLRTWIEEGTAELRDRGRITDGARAWARPAGRRPRCGAAAGWRWRGNGRPTRPSGRHCPAQALSFVDASVAAGAASERAARRRTRRLQATVAVLAALVLAVAGLSGYAFSQRFGGPWRRGRQALQAASDADSRDMAFTADQLRGQDPAVAAQLSVARASSRATPQATASLLESSGAPSVARIDDSRAWCSGWPSARTAGCSRRPAPTGRCGCGTWPRPGARCWPAPCCPANSRDPLYAAAFSPNGKICRGRGRGPRGTAVEGLPGPRRSGWPGRCPGRPAAMYSVAFSPDSATLAAASADDTVWLWHVADPAHRPRRPPLSGRAGGVQSVTFSPDGRTLAAGSADDTVWLWSHRPEPGLAAGAARAARWPARDRPPGDRGGVQPGRQPGSPPPARTQSLAVADPRPAAPPRTAR